MKKCLENEFWEQPQIRREAFYWTSPWEKWYEHYSSLSASTIPAIKWKDQEELTISASKDLACLWMEQEDMKFNHLQDQSVLNTCICRKVFLIACSKKQCWITLHGSWLLVRVVRLIYFSLPSPQGRKWWVFAPILALAHLLLLFQAGSAELPAALVIMKSHFTPLFILLPTGVPGSGWQIDLPGHLWNREAMPRNKQPVWKLCTWICVWP